MQLSKRDFINIGWILVYGLIFLVLRLFSSSSAMTLDEAELFLDAEHYRLGFDDQPPLYSWIIKTFAYVFGLNVPLMVVVNQALICIFLITVYFILRHFWNSETSQIILLSYVFIFLYSYDYYRYMIHTTLMVTIAAIAFLIYLNLLTRAKPISYCLLGLSMSLGILAKYNFVFFAFVILLISLSSKLGRKRLINYKTFYFLIFLLLPLIPHCYWLYEHNFLPIYYTLDRGEAGHLQGNIFSVLLDLVWQPLVYIGIFAVFFHKEFHKQDTNKYNYQILRSAFIYAYLVPLISIIIFQIGNFSQRWLAPVNFLLPIICFSFVKMQNKHKLFKAICISLVIIIYCLKFTAFYLPDFYKKTIFIHIPHKELYSNLGGSLVSQKHTQNSLDEVNILVYKDLLIYAGIKSFNPNAKLSFASKNNISEKIQNADFIFWNDENTDETIKSLIKEPSKISSLKSTYTRSNKETFYKVNYYEQ